MGIDFKIIVQMLNFGKRNKKLQLTVATTDLGQLA